MVSSSGGPLNGEGFPLTRGIDGTTGQHARAGVPQANGTAPLAHADVLQAAHFQPGVNPDKVPRHHRVHRHDDPNHEHHGFDHLGERIQMATHAGVKPKHLRAVAVLGRIGWVAKGIVYALIGGLCCRAAVSDAFTQNNIDTSPQGAFVLIGKGATGIYILIIMAAALATYICWRFWEGITGQGRHPVYGKFKNFFTFRLSPMVSGAVYTAYLVYILTLIPKAFDYKNDKVGKTHGSDFTRSWRTTWIGRAGLVILAIAFIIATITQLLNVLTRKFHRELRLKELRTWVKWVVLTAGHIGYIGRAALFLMVAILMCRSINSDSAGERDKNTITNAFDTLETSKGGRAVLFLIGFGLIVYSLFAVLNAYPAKIFPTPLPSQREIQEIERKRAEKARLKAEAKQGRFDVVKGRLAKVVPLANLGEPRAGPTATGTAENATASHLPQTGTIKEPPIANAV